MRIRLIAKTSLSTPDPGRLDSNPKTGEPRRAQGENRLERLLQQLLYPKLLVIDEIGYLPMTREEASLFFPAVVPALREGEPGFDVEQEFSGLGRDLRGPGDGQRHSGPAAAPRHYPEHQGGKLSAQGETQGGKRGTPGSGSGRETGRAGGLRKLTTKTGRALEKSERLSQRGGMLSGVRDRFNPEKRINIFPLDTGPGSGLPRSLPWWQRNPEPPGRNNPGQRPHGRSPRWDRGFRTRRNTTAGWSAESVPPPRGSSGLSAPNAWGGEAGVAS